MNKIKFLEYQKKIIKLSYENEEELKLLLEKTPLGELKRIESPNRFDYLIEINLVNKIMIPEKAIRIKDWKGDSVFEKSKNRFFIFKERVLITYNSDESKLKIEYIKQGKNTLLFNLYHIIHWLLINISLKEGASYFKGNAIKINGKIILLLGDSEFYLTYLSQVLGEIIALDNFTLKKNIISNLLRFPTINKKNLPLKLIKFLNEKPQENKIQEEEIKQVIFLNEWNEETTEYKEISLEEIIKKLIKLNKLSMPYFSEDNLKEIKENYKINLSNIKIWDFYIGFNEENLKQKVLELINSP